MSVDLLLSRLDKVRRLGQRRWQACCPAHDDRGPSLAIRLGDDERVLVHCFAGCGVNEVMGAVGLNVSDLFLERLGGNEPLRAHRRPFPAADVLRCIAFEALVVMLAGAALLEGRPFAPADRDRLSLAVGRIQVALDVGGLNGA
ncbi:hypothetical protein [Aromatoleum toluclasticum]|uniref:hypothetical protein n=1 Tax=Aromatoleum toluclasticum TaxID=92003 RepID=UPI000A049F11|nr:hypothetical protein [Aromatoleum toluclasticum]